MDGVVCPLCGSDQAVKRWMSENKCILYSDSIIQIRFVRVEIPEGAQLYVCNNCVVEDISGGYRLHTLFDADGKIFCVEDSFQLKIKHMYKPERGG